MIAIKYLLIIFSILMVLFGCNVSFAMPHQSMHDQHRTKITSRLKKRPMIVDINQADTKQLLTLKGIGEKKSAAIVSYRKKHGPFASLKDLIKVPGIGNHSLQRIIKNNPGRLVVKAS